MVSIKNRIERFVFALKYIQNEFSFDHNIFIDEATVRVDKNGHTAWYGQIEGESGLFGRNAHETSIHVIGGISRRGVRFHNF